MSSKHVAHSLAYIRWRYQVPARHGQRIRFTDFNKNSCEGTIISADGPHLRARMDDGRILFLHPNWHIEYLSVEKGR